MNFPSFYMNFILCILNYFPQGILLFSFYGKLLRSFVYVIIYCVGAGITTLMSLFDAVDPYFFRRKKGKTRSMREEMDGSVFVSRQSRHFLNYR